MKMTASLLTICLLLFSNFAQSQLQNFYGEYYALEKFADSFYLNENCWSKQIDMLYISAYGEGESYKHTLTFDSFHAVNYVLEQEEELEGNMLYVKGRLEDEMDESSTHFYLWNVNDDIIGLHEKDQPTIYFTRNANRNKFPFVPCKENEEVTEIVVIEEPVVEDEFSKQARMKQYLLSFLDPLFKREEVKLNEYIIPSGYRFKYPGFDPYAEAQFDASKMIQNSYFNDFIKPIKNNSWTKLPVYFVEELPTPCTENKVKKGIHVRIRGIGDVQRLEVVIYLTNGSSDSNAMQLELVISNRHTLRSLQLIECNN